ncbi:MAG: DUF4861 family protein [Bacteroidales bacterium]
MKKLFLVPIAGFILSCSTPSSYELLITNNTQFPVKDAGLSIKATDLKGYKQMNQGMVPVLRDESDNLFPTQADDLDGNGFWDELFVITDLDKNEEKRVSLTFVEQEDYPEFTYRTNIRFARKDHDYMEVTTATREQHAINTETQKVWQMEGIAWENDRVGFRNYFDLRNGMDIFGKVTTKMVLDEVGTNENPDYHTFDPSWGVDVLKVGNSLGAGSIAYQYMDSLYRVGDNGPGSCEILTEGPLRSVFRFTFPEWKMGDQTIEVIHDISISAGTYYYESSVTYRGTEAELQLVAGIVNSKSRELHNAGRTENINAFYTFDLQSEDTTNLGMGIMVGADAFAGITMAPAEGAGITETYCIHLNTAQSVTNKFRFYTVWERENEQWETADGFEELLNREAILMAEPPSWSLVK